MTNTGTNPAPQPLPDYRKKLGTVVKDLVRDPANFGRHIDTLVAEECLTAAQADKFRDMLADAEIQPTFNAKARAYNELGNELTTEVAYFIGRTLTQPTQDPEAASTRREAYVGAGGKWLNRHLPNL